jgi:hypothetical protein
VRTPIELHGTRSTGKPCAGTVYVPEAFPYLQMKLSAFADRKEDKNEDLGRHHALDADTIVGMMTEAEYHRARSLAGRSRIDPHFTRVCDIAATEFAGSTAPGMLRLREHRLFRQGFRLDDFAAVLAETFFR